MSRNAVGFWAGSQPWIPRAEPTLDCRTHIAERERGPIIRSYPARSVSLGKQGRLDYVNFGTHVPAFKPLPKVHDYTLLFTRNGRAPYILGCVAEIVTANGWKTFIFGVSHLRGR